MLSTRRDQENAVHNRQTATAVKNDALKSIVSETPANRAPKTPFAKRRNDENLAKATAKDKSLSLFGQRKDDNAFVTPAGKLDDVKTIVRAI